MSKDFPNIIEAKALENYKLFLKFDDGISGIVDLSSFKGKGVFAYWNNYDNFFKFEIIYNSITWNDSLDLDTLNLYLTITNKSFDEYANC